MDVELWSKHDDDKILMIVQLSYNMVCHAV